MRPAAAIRTVLIALLGSIAGVAVALVSDMSLPVSAMNGRWQIEDWLVHPESTAEARRRYASERRPYPRIIEVRPFWKASVDSETDCSWSQHVRAWMSIDGPTDIWETTISCEGFEPLKLWSVPSHRDAHARSLAGWKAYVTDMNDREIGVTFDAVGDVRDIFYVPASWPRPVAEAS